MTMQLLSQAHWVCGARCDQTVLHRCVLCVGVLSTPSVDFLEFLTGNRNHHHLSDDVEHHELQLVCHCVSFATAMLKMKMLPAGFPVALCSTAIQFSDRHSNRSFFILRIVDLLVDVADVLDVPVSEIVAFAPSERLALKSFVLVHRQILVAVEEAFGAHQHSDEESNVWRSATVQFNSWKVVSFKSDAIEKHDFFFANIVLCQRISVFFLCIPSWENCRMAPTFLALLS